jgi:hypothetical protein
MGWLLSKFRHPYLKMEADGFPIMLVLIYNIRMQHIPVHHDHYCKILKFLICDQCYYTVICIFVLQRRRASIAAFRPLDSQDSTKASNTSLTFGVSSQQEGRVVYRLVGLLFIFVSATMYITCLGPHRVLRFFHSQ